MSLKKKNNDEIDLIDLFIILWNGKLKIIFICSNMYLLRFELDCGRQAAKPRRVKNASQSMLQRFFLFPNQANGMGDLISVLQPHTNVK